MALLDAAYLVVLLLAACSSVLVGVVAWRRRSARSATPLAVLSAAVAVWTLGSTASILVDGFGTSVALARLSYVGIVGVPPAFLVLALVYTGRGEWVDRRLVAALAVEPVVVLAAHLVAPDLVWTAVPDPGVPSGMTTGWGPVFWVHIVYAYLLVGAGTAMLLELLYRSQHLYSKQVAALLVGVVTPWVANLLYVTNTIDFDPTPVSFAVAGAALGWAILSAQFVDLSPVARDTVVDNVNHAVFVVDGSDRLTDVNPAAADLLGVTKSDLGEPLAQALDRYPELVDTFADVSEDREEVVLDTPGGQRAFDVEVTSLSDYRGETLGRLFLVQDVTERRRYERELERQNEQLEQFASVVSHDLRNPLNVLDGYVEMARESGDVSHLEEAATSIDRMNRLIEDVLTLAREGRQIDDLERVSVREVATDAWDGVDTGAATLSVDDDLRVRADRSRLQQAFENLFRNAVEHGSTSPDSQARQDAVEHGSTSPQQAGDAVEHGSTSSRPEADDAAEHAGTDVTVEVGAVDDGTGFYVADDGPGIPEDDREAVFEYGYSTSPDGTGLGLAIVDAIADAHGWSLSLAEGPGARFEFRDAGVVTEEPLVGVDGQG